MKSWLVVEGPPDAAILAPILRALSLDDVSIEAAGGKAVMTSFARSIALTRQGPVAVVMDADTTDRSLLSQQETIFNDLTSWSGRNHACKLFQAVPTLEEALFPRVHDFEEMFSVALSKEQKSDFKANRAAFLRTWIMAPDGGRGGAVPLNGRKARAAINASGLLGLPAYLQGASREAAPAA